MRDEDIRLAYLVALDKKLQMELGCAKAAARDSLLEAFEETGCDRKAIMVGDERVGDVSISYAAAGPVIRPGYEMDAIEELESIGMVEYRPAKGWEQAYEFVNGKVVNRYTGAVAEWATWEGRKPRGAAIRGCKPDDVLGALNRLGYDYDPVKLLEGGE